jgi:hypothetical protein
MAAGVGEGKLRNGSAECDSANLASEPLGEPKVAVRSLGDPVGILYIVTRRARRGRLGVLRDPRVAAAGSGLVRNRPPAARSRRARTSSLAGASARGRVGSRLERAGAHF